MSLRSFNQKSSDKLRDILGSRFKRFVEMGITTVEQLAAYTPARLQNLGLIDDYDEAAKIIRRALMEMEKRIAYDYEARMEISKLPKLTTGVKAIDTLLGGGLEPGKIYGLVGEFGSGKSRFCHQLCVTIQLPPIKGKAIYMDAENVYREELIANIAKRFGLDPEEVSKNILVINSTNYFFIEEFLRKEWPLYIHHGYNLLIIDTLVGPYRQEFAGRGQLAERQQRINALLGWILNHIRMYNIYCVITDQIQAVPEIGGGVRIVGGHVVAHGITYWYWISSRGGGIRCIRAYDVIHQKSGESAEFKMTDKGLEDLED